MWQYLGRQTCSCGTPWEQCYRSPISLAATGKGYECGGPGNVDVRNTANESYVSLVSNFQGYGLSSIMGNIRASDLVKIHGRRFRLSRIPYVGQ